MSETKLMGVMARIAVACDSRERGHIDGVPEWTYDMCGQCGHDWPEHEDDCVAVTLADAAALIETFRAERDAALAALQQIERVAIRDMRTGGGTDSEWLARVASASPSEAAHTEGGEDD